MYFSALGLSFEKHITVFHDIYSMFEFIYTHFGAKVAQVSKYEA